MGIGIRSVNDIFLKLCPGWPMSVIFIVLLPVKLKLMNPTLVQREFEAKEDVEQDLKQLSSTSFNAMAGSIPRLFQMPAKPVCRRL